MMADIILRKRDYDEAALFDPAGRYGAYNWASLGLMVVACVIGWGLVVNGFAEDAAWNNWQGYLLGLVGGRDSVWAYGNIGVIASLLLGFFGYLGLSRGKVRTQEG